MEAVVHILMLHVMVEEEREDWYREGDFNFARFRIVSLIFWAKARRESIGMNKDWCFFERYDDATGDYKAPRGAGETFVTVQFQPAVNFVPPVLYLQ